MTIVKELETTPENLANLPELTNAALEAARWDTSTGCLIDRVYPGRPLFVCFSFRELQYLRAFDFFGRTKKWEDRTGLKFNRILLRDVFNSWYQRGVPGLGTNIDEVAGSLHTLIEAIAPTRVFTIGQSMGAYAAIMFGMLLGADRIAAFGTLSHLDPDEASRLGDFGFHDAMRALKASPPSPCHADLLRLGKAVRHRGELHLIFGTHPRNDDGVSSNFDAMHALRLAQLPDVILHPYPGADHGIVPWLIDGNLLDDLIAEVFAEREHRAPIDPGGMAEQTQGVENEPVAVRDGCGVSR